MIADDRELAELLARIVEGDQIALRTLYDTVSAKLFGISMRILGEESQAEEVVQDVFLKIWTEAAKYEHDRGKAITWMSVMTRNRCIDALRKAARRPRISQSVPDAADMFAEPDGHQSDPEDRLTLLECLARLDEVQRKLVLEAYFDGFTREELALRHARPVGTIKTWLRAALGSLRRCLGFADPDK